VSCEVSYEYVIHRCVVSHMCVASSRYFPHVCRVDEPQMKKSCHTCVTSHIFLQPPPNNPAEASVSLSVCVACAYACGHGRRCGRGCKCVHRSTYVCVHRSICVCVYRSICVCVHRSICVCVHRSI